MRTEQVTVNHYRFDELSEEAKENAIEKLADINVDHDWWEFVEEDIVECGAILGITVEKLYFSGFWSQGDGACFEGSYEYVKGSKKKIREFVPKNEELHKIADDLYEIQRKSFYKLSAYIKHSGHYYHERCTNINVYREADRASDEEEEAIAEILRDFMQWSYSRLEGAYEYLTSEEAIVETINANEYEFDEQGNLN